MLPPSTDGWSVTEGVVIEQIDAVVLTHAHLDHSGYLPVMARDGYTRAIHCAGGNALLQPAKYVRGLADSLPKSVDVYERSAVQSLRRTGRDWQARTEAGVINATQVLACVGAFLPRVGVHQSGTFPLELSASITRPLTEARWQSQFGERTWGVLSTLPGGATLRLLPGRRLLIRNTVEYRQRDLNGAQLQARRQQHLQGLEKRFPGLSAKDLEYTWTGHLSGTRSGEPCFARIDEGLHAVAGCNGSGVARGTLALIPNALREAAYALGTPKWKVILSITLKSARAGVITGILLAVARIAGETAPLLFTALSNQFWTTNLGEPMASLPVTIFKFAMSPFENWQKLAWAGVFLITIGVLALNIIARTLFRQR